MLTPSSNTVVEPYTQALLAPLFPEVTAHFSRLRVLTISLDAVANQQFDLAPMQAAADLLVDAKVDVMAWNGTSSSWLGFDKDVALTRALEAQTRVATTSAILGLNALLAAMSVRRLALVTPYVGSVQQRIIANYAAIGVEVVAERHLETSDNFAFAEVSEARIAELCREVAKARPEAIAIVCTNMRGPMIARALEAELGITILDSVAFTLWATLARAQVDMAPLHHFGRLFTVDGSTLHP
ncbi:MAG: Asp/Glu/hydantoin racemase [Geminicoccaceae bacterium]|nr:MAG: Asp/Glu/hydantoin racemase [Geminicoccaceae bacterium]